MNENDYPPGFKLLYRLIGYRDEINRIAWSPDGQGLAVPFKHFSVLIWDMANTKYPKLLKNISASSGSPVRYICYVSCVVWSPDGHLLAAGSGPNVLLWDTTTGDLLKSLKGHADYVRTIAWIKDGRAFVSGDNDGNVLLWNVETMQTIRAFTKHSGEINSLSLSPGDQTLASACADGTILLHDIKTGKLRQALRGHHGGVNDIIWMPNGETLISCSDDHTIRLWSRTKRTEPIVQSRILEDHTAPIVSISLSSDGLLLASKSRDGTVRLWRSETWQRVSILYEPNSDKSGDPSLAFHPKFPVLATLDKGDTVVRIWQLDTHSIFSTAITSSSAYYTNAKVVLVGDAGVGKSGLGLVLSGHPFAPTESTHSRRIWTFDSQEVELDGTLKETREIILWDMAGQPAYRLIHQLHLQEVTIALILFDSHSETDPFAGVSHWCRALQQAQYIQGSSALPLKKFLVAARQDRGGREVSRSRIESLIRELGIDGYFETSAKEGWQIAELAMAIRCAINWDSLPKVSSSILFQRIKNFLIAQKGSAERILSTVDDLYQTFLSLESIHTPSKALRAQFETCIGLIESRDLIRQFSFGSLVLLQPEILDVYASALINAVKNEPDGLGCISEETAQRGGFFVPKDERLNHKEQEKLLLIAMVEDLLRHEIALREYAADGPYLVFPSQSMRENPSLPDPEGKRVLFHFEGPVLNIYTTLVIRLSHSGLFEMKELWKNAVTYKASVGGTYGVSLRNFGEGRGELTLFFDELAGAETCFHFEEYVQTHLQRKALPDSIQRERVFSCPTCKTAFTNAQVVRRRQLGFSWITCSVCDQKVKLLDREEQSLDHIWIVSQMDHAADVLRESEAVASILEGKRKIGYFDVFFCYKGEDKDEVKSIGEKLLKRGILPWLDEWELQPGVPWQPVLEKQIGNIKSAAVFIGKDGIGPWQYMELRALLSEFVNRGEPVIPVLLPSASNEPDLPIFLKGMTWVDFRKHDPNPMERLVWGITGKRNKLK